VPDTAFLASILPRNNSENRVFATKTAGMAHSTERYFSYLDHKIRYLRDQRNFSPDQRIKGAVTTE
jgi:hypothetical protein